MWILENIEVKKRINGDFYHIHELELLLIIAKMSSPPSRSIDVVQFWSKSQQTFCRNWQTDSEIQMEM